MANKKDNNEKSIPLKRPKGVSDTQWEKAEELYEAAVAVGDPAPELTVAQAALESAWFKKTSGKNNYFGQKASASQKGTDVKTHEYDDSGKKYNDTERFRDYETLEEAMRDRQRLWGSKYAEAESLSGAINSIWSYDEEKQRGVGYATDPEYGGKITSILKMMGADPEAPLEKLTGDQSINPDLIADNPNLDDGAKEELMRANSSEGLASQTIQDLNRTSGNSLLSGYTGAMDLNSFIVDNDTAAKQKKAQEQQAAGPSNQGQEALGYTGAIGAFDPKFNLLEAEDEASKGYKTGGKLDAQSSANILTEYNQGGSHEANPNGGIPVGQNSKGGMNLVEQGETRFGDYIYSNEFKLSDKDAKRFNISPVYVGKKYSDISKEINDQIKTRPYDRLVKKTAEGNLNKLMMAQETVRQAKMTSEDNTFNEGGDLTQANKGAGIGNAIGGATGLFSLGVENLGPTGIDTTGAAGRQDLIKNRGINAAGDALKGAAAGAAIGSAVPVIGTAIGAVGGALYGGISSVFGDAKKNKQIQEANINAAIVESNVHRSEDAIAKTGGLLDSKYKRGSLLDLYYTDPTDPVKKKKDSTTTATDPYVGELRVAPADSTHVFNPEPIENISGVPVMSAYDRYMANKNKNSSTSAYPSSKNRVSQPPAFAPTPKQIGEVESFSRGELADKYPSSKTRVSQPAVFRQGAPGATGPQRATPEQTAALEAKREIGAKQAAEIGLINAEQEAKAKMNADREAYNQEQLNMYEQDAQSQLDAYDQKSLNALANNNGNQFLYTGWEASNALRNLNNTNDVDLYNSNASNRQAKTAQEQAAFLKSNPEADAASDESSLKGQGFDELLRYAPTLGNALQLLTLPKAEVERYDRLDNRYIPQYADEMAMQNIVSQGAANTRSAIQQASGGSQSAARASLLGSQINEQRALSEAYMNMDNINRGQDEKAQQFNLGVDQYNQQVDTQETIANAQNRAARDMHKNNLTQSLLNDMGAIGKEAKLARILSNTTDYNTDGTKVGAAHDSLIKRTFGNMFNEGGDLQSNPFSSLFEEDERIKQARAYLKPKY